MKDEFPSLEEVEHQKDFLRDWWSPKKLFIGSRGSGKSELMLSELRRFGRHGFSCALFAPSRTALDSLEDRYYSRFGEHNPYKTFSYFDLSNGGVRGYKIDVVIMDEIQKISLEDINREILPMSPAFFRASACRSDMNKFHYLNNDNLDNEQAFFDAVYTDD